MRKQSALQKFFQHDAEYRDVLRRERLQNNDKVSKKRQKFSSRVTLFYNDSTDIELGVDKYEYKISNAASVKSYTNNYTTEK